MVDRPSAPPTTFAPVCQVVETGHRKGGGRYEVPAGQRQVPTAFQPSGIAAGGMRTRPLTLQPTDALQPDISNQDAGTLDLPPTNRHQRHWPSTRLSWFYIEPTSLQITLFGLNDSKNYGIYWPLTSRLFTPISCARKKKEMTSPPRSQQPPRLVQH